MFLKIQNGTMGLGAFRETVLPREEKFRNSHEALQAEHLHVCTNLKCWNTATARKAGVSVRSSSSNRLYTTCFWNAAADSKKLSLILFRKSSRSMSLDSVRPSFLCWPHYLGLRLGLTVFLTVVVHLCWRHKIK